MTKRRVDSDGFEEGYDFKSDEYVFDSDSDIVGAVSDSKQRRERTASTTSDSEQSELKKSSGDKVVTKSENSIEKYLKQLNYRIERIRIQNKKQKSE